MAPAANKLPNLAGSLALVTVLYCLFVFGAGEQLFRDSDTGWHIRTGEWILDHRTLPRTDLYSFSKPGEPWFAWEWGSDVLMGIANRQIGLGGVVALYAAAIAICTYLSVTLAFSAGADFLSTALMSIPLVTTASLHWLARPHVLGWVFLLTQLLLIQTYQSRRWFVPILIAAVWTNFHASFFLAVAIPVVFAVFRKSRDLALVSLGCALATLCNPYGWKLHSHVAQYLLDSDLTSNIAEFQSFNFHDKQATWIVVALLVTMAGAAYAALERKGEHALLMFALVFGGLRSARVLPLMALAGLPLAVAAISRRVRPHFTGFFQESDGLHKIDRQLSRTTGLALSLLLVFIASPASAKGFASSSFPVIAADKIPAGARLLSNDHFGGYLIYRFRGDLKVFFDGRSDYYGADFMKRYLTLSQVRPGWKEILSEYRFTHALLPPDSALAAALEDRGWRRMYTDKTAVLLEHN